MMYDSRHEWLSKPFSPEIREPISILHNPLHFGPSPLYVL
jgi:hypothetical protein